jgi:Tfp pilus assembly protein PilO
MILELQKYWIKISVWVMLIAIGAIAVLVFILKMKGKNAEFAKIEAADDTLKVLITDREDQIAELDVAVEIEKEKRKERKIHYAETGEKIKKLSTKELIALANKRRRGI